MTRQERTALILAILLTAVLAIAVLAIAGRAQTPTPDPAPCLRVPLAVVVDLNDDRQAPVIDHVRDAVRAGQPRVLHIDRVDAVAHRRLSLAHIPARPGLDRDEYPPAASQEGGAGADIRYISPRANRSAGATMGAQLADFCPGQPFIVEP